MAFRFKLDAVLRFRESVERTEEAVLHRIVREIAEAQLELERIDLRQAQLREQRERDLAQTLPAVHLLEIVEQEQQLNQIADGIRTRLQQLDIQRIRQMTVYRSAHQDRQVLSELREQQQRSYGVEQRRQEQKMLDDMFLSRWQDRGQDAD
jgi:flagellar export protein FliJ